MLESARLVGNLREFCDGSYARFRSFPTMREQARREWAAAFDDYFNQVQEQVVPRVPGHPSLLTGSVKSAFFGQIQLRDGISAAQAASDFAAAWQAAVGAVTAGTPVPAGPVTYTFLLFNNVASLHATLLTRLTALFLSPSASTLSRLSEIADAFHDASSGLLANVTITSAGGTAPGVMSVV